MMHPPPQWNNNPGHDLNDDDDKRQSPPPSPPQPNADEADHPTTIGRTQAHGSTTGKVEATRRREMTTRSAETAATKGAETTRRGRDDPTGEIDTE